MTTTILLIRHGQTDWNKADRWQGHEDIPLNQTGREQAAMLARRLSSWPITAVYSSDLKRAAETAEILADELGLVQVSSSAWRERHCGVFQGLTNSQIQEQYPEAWAAFRKDGVGPPGGESTVDMRQRVLVGFHQLLECHPGETVAVVTHGGTVRALVGYVLGLPPDRPLPIRANGNTGISIVEIDQDCRPLLLRLNDVAHLEMALYEA